MRTVSDDYSSQVRSNTRRFGFYVAVYGNSETPDYLWLDGIISISITRAFSDGIQIGACMSDRLTLTTRATDLFNGRLKKVKIYCRCTDPVTEWHTLGTFYVDSSVTERGITTVNAYDMMGRLGKPVKWTDHTLAAAPTFPCKMQEVLDYLCARAAVTTDFQCQDFTIENAPDGYTARELIGYIAACHGANARFSPDEVLQIRLYTQTGAVIDRNRCYGTDVAADGGYTVKGILFDLGGETRIFIDGSSSEYDPDADGILECFVPFATVASAEYAWSQVGGMSCSACSFTLPAEDIFEVGDVFSSADANGSTVTAAVTEQELSVNCDGGFVERIACAAQGKKNQRDISNRVTAAEEDISEGGGTGDTIEHAVIIQQRDMTKFLHEYSFARYIFGNQMVYGGAANPVICQGEVALLQKPSSPQSSVYTMQYAPTGSTGTVQPLTVECKLLTVRNTGTEADPEWYYDYRITATRGDGTVTNKDVTTSEADSVGLALYYSSINDVSALRENLQADCPYGAINATIGIVGASGGFVTGYFPFCSEAEYNAAVGLTYEPKYLTEVTDTVTEVDNQ